MKTKVIAATALLALGASAQAQLSGQNRPGIGASPGTFQTPSSSVGSTGTGQSVSSDTLMRPGQTPSTQGTFGSQDRINSTLPDTARPNLPDIAPSLPNVTTGSQIENPAGVFRNSPAPSSGATPRTGVGSVDATQGAVDPFGTPIIRRNDDLNGDLNGIGGPAPGETGIEGRRVTPPPNFVPVPHPLGDTSSTGTLGSPNSTTVNPGTAGGSQAAKVGSKMGSDLNTTGVNTPPRAPQQPLDQALSAKIRAQLSQTPLGEKPAVRLNGDAIRDMRITSQNGRIVLEGMVNSPPERDLIDARVREVQGVAAVDNRLKVRDQNVGAPASSESGQAQQGRTSGESKQNSSELNEEHSGVSPDR